MIGVRTVDHTQGVDHANGIHSEYLSWSDTMRYVSKYNPETNQNEFLNVRVSFDQVERDAQGHLLGYVFLESGEMLNALLIQDGSARTKVDSENKTWLHAFYYIEGVAFDNGRGGWGKKDPFPEYKEM
ncbi:thermonuclease family protein [Ammoniphilus sp. 3BR4]|uniref:thermonuclease family protein n=1 Tax=Ammoniphilus sp. 3BR4 TaxID=3158265 RepID=UPI003465006D